MLWSSWPPLLAVILSGAAPAMPAIYPGPVRRQVLWKPPQEQRKQHGPLMLQRLARVMPVLMARMRPQVQQKEQRE